MSKAQKEQQAVRDLHRAVQEDDPEAVLEAADRLVAVRPKDAQGLECRGTALLRLGRHEEAAAALEGLEGQQARFSLAYCLYKQLAHERCLEVLAALRKDLGSVSAPGEGSVAAGVLHLEAQVRYRLGEFDVCANIYDEHFGAEALQEDDELVANRVAADLGAGRHDAAKRLADECPHTTFEIEYNAACAMVGAGELDEALAKLDRAERLCRETLADEDEEDLLAELAVMQAQRGYVEQRLGRTERAAELYHEALRGAPEAANVVVTANNNLVSLRAREEKVFDSVKRSDRCLKVAPAKMSIDQREGVRLNRCLLMLNSKKAAECRRLAEELRGEWPDRAEPVLALASQLFREKRHKECAAVLAEFAEAHAGAEGADQCRLAAAHVALQRGDAAAAAASLAEVRGLRHQPAWVATLLAVQAKAGQAEASGAVLDAAVAHWKDAGSAGPELGLLLERSAELRVAQGRAKEAVELFEQLVRERSDDPLVVSSAVMASALVDPESSAKFAAHLPQVPGVDAVDVDALLAAPAPRTAAARAAAREERKEAAAKEKKAEEGEAGQDAAAAAAAKDGDAEAAAARKKAAKKKKRKIRYPKGFDPKNPGPMPDPERWLPRWQRKKGRKGRRRHNPMRGPQGAVPADDVQESPARGHRREPSQAEKKTAPHPNLKGKKKKKKGGRR